MIDSIQESTEQFLSGGGEMGELIRAMDWSKTALGPISTWPQSLRTSVSLCLSSTFPILIAWGEETIQIYNDSYRPICGAKHPESMGQNFRICWETALPVVGDKFTRGQHGEGTYIKDQRMFLDRYGYLEESFMTFSFAPIRDESGGVGGIFHPITETTEKMLSGRRTQVLRDLGAALGKAKTISEIGTATQSLYQSFELDIPFLLFYQFKEGSYDLISSAGLDVDSPVAPKQINAPFIQYPIQGLHSGLEFVEVTSLGSLFGAFSCGPYEDAPHSAMLLPVRISGQTELFGFVVAGVSVRRALDNDYQNFYSQLGNTFNTAVSNVYAYEQEQKRAEALAEIDRSKTAFFSNVSHEFRTPLTLMLGPLEELITSNELQENERQHLEASHRNALRLLKLVNNLLDYSRVEAGRMKATYSPVNLSALTEDLASCFRSIIEKAGMKLIVKSEALKENYYVDQQMWEKIVLNLLSNAFKYTLEGEITVSLSENNGFATLTVTDTGVGIPEKEIPHMFDRFHRIENTAGRTHEGTGIGLSLVHELVQLHGGQISVESIEGEGSVFSVKLPKGKAHLPSSAVIEEIRSVDSSLAASAFVKEAASLLEDTRETEVLEEPLWEANLDAGVKILVVDDNRDMRSYLKRLLDPHFKVALAFNGAEALEKIQIENPDLVLSDVMMPVMDGKQMLERIRANKATQSLPVIFLSARAGEEARIDGLEAGADDYLIKPFSSAELLTKIRAQINIGRTRSFAEQRLRQLLKQAPVAIAVYRGPSFIVELANAGMLAYSGLEEKDIVGYPLFDRQPVLKEQGFEQIMENVFVSGEPFESGEIEIETERLGQKEKVYVHLTIEPLREQDGQINGLITVAADVTEQVVARLAVEKVQRKLALAIDASTMGIWKSDWNTGSLEVSETARIIHGIPEGLVLTYADGLSKLVAPEHQHHVNAAIEEAVLSKGRFAMEYEIVPMDGSKRKWVSSSGMVEVDAAGNEVSIIGTILDITEAKHDEIRKNDFIGMVSHELKTPLTSLSGYSQLATRMALKKNDHDYVGLFEKSNAQLRKMSVMINSFLNVSQLESGKINLNLSKFDISELIAEVVSDVSLTAPGYQFINNTSVVEVLADREKIGTVITNLLGNAVKYGKKNGTITVTCNVELGKVRVSVTDQGAGIKTTELDRLFDRFYRVDSDQTKQVGGFGIGLYLSAEIVKRHNGTIWAESELGTGSKFNFELPIV
ncbi:MAG: response regulator [Pedobacter sp.]|nr:MAG: response regulator [Pedobacter sp.]